MGEGDFTKVDGEPLYASGANYKAGNVTTVEAGETIAVGDVVFIYGSGHANKGEAWLSDADVQDKNRVNGIAIGTGGNDGDTIQIVTRGVYTTTGLTAKETYYLSATAGDLTTTPSGVKIGQAISTTELFINIIQDDRDTLGKTSSYMKNQTGLPSNNLTAFWVECNGQTLSDTESTMDGQTIPDLNGYQSAATKRFLRGGGAGDGSTPPVSDDGSGNTAQDTSSHRHANTNDTHAHFHDGAGRVEWSGNDVADFDSRYNKLIAPLPPSYNTIFIMKIK